MPLSKNMIAGVILALSGSAFFGFIPLFAIPLLRQGYSVETVALYRFGLAALILAPCLLRSGKKSGFRLKSRIMTVASFYFLDVIFFFHALKFLSGGIVATLEFLCPVITLIVMLLFFHQKYKWQAGLAIALALLGVWLLSSSPDSGNPGSSISTGILLSLLAAFFNALYYIGFKWIGPQGPDAIETTFYVMLACAILCFLHGLLTGNLAWIKPGLPLLCAGLLALVTAVLSNLCLILAIQKIGPLLVSILGVMEPVAAVLAGVAFFGEKMTIGILAGLLCSLCAVLVAIKSAEGK